MLPRSAGVETSSFHSFGTIGRCSRRHCLYSEPYASGAASSRMWPAHHATTSLSPQAMLASERFLGLERTSAIARPRLGFSAMKRRIVRLHELSPPVGRADLLGTAGKR